MSCQYPPINLFILLLFFKKKIILLNQECLNEIQHFLFQRGKCVPSGVKDYVKQQLVSFTAVKNILKAFKEGSASMVIVSCMSLHATVLAKKL